MWHRSTALLTDGLDRSGLPYAAAEGEAAFYGPLSKSTAAPSTRGIEINRHPQCHVSTPRAVYVQATSTSRPSHGATSVARTAPLTA